MANVACVSSTPSSSGYTVLLQAPGKSSIQRLCSTTLPSSLNSASLCETRQVASLTVSLHNCHWRRRGPRGNCRGILQHPPHANAEMMTATEAEEALSHVEEDEANVRDISRGILPFKKYQGLGNDFILVDNRDSSQPKISPEQAITLCDRNFGIGADGVIFAMPGVKGSDYTMRIFNSDGSEPEMCGNGIRCMARFVAELENNKETRSYNIHTLAGLIIPKLRDDGQVEVDMGPPILNAADVPTQLPSNKDGFVIKEPLLVEGRKWLVTCVSMGNPHCVIFASEESEALDVNSLPLQNIGPHFEHHKVFPARTNTEFVQVLSPSHLRMRVWERGAGATLACGTGACAVVVAAVLEGRTSKKCTVDLPGGPLEIEWRENNHVYMTGPAKAVFEGRAFL